MRSASQWGVPADVPLERRGSIGAMAVTTGSQMPDIEKPYVYRGTGVDQMPEAYAAMISPVAPRPKRKPRRVAKRRPLRVHQPYKPWVNWGMYPAGYSARPAREPVQQSARLVRPAPGWLPPTGEMIDSLLDEVTSRSARRGVRGG